MRIFSISPRDAEAVASTNRRLVASAAQKRADGKVDADGLPAVRWVAASLGIPVGVELAPARGMLALVKNKLKPLLDVAPGRERLLTLIARFPPEIKRPWLIRASAVIHGHTMRRGDMVTNLGIDHRLRIVLPAGSGPDLLFGRPRWTIGERGALYLAAALAPLCSAFVDVGAHVGVFLYYLASTIGSKIPLYYFEPDPEFFALIQRNLALNGFDNAVGYCAAVGDHDGTATFYLDLDDPSSNSLGTRFTKKHATRAVTVPIMTFTTFVCEAGLRRLCVKVDVEDAEFEFLAGATDALASIEYLIMEVLPPQAERGFLELMQERHGLQVYYIDDCILRPCERGRYTPVERQWNFLFCRESPPELREILRGTELTVQSST